MRAIEQGVQALENVWGDTETGEIERHFAASEQAQHDAFAMGDG